MNLAPRYVALLDSYVKHGNNKLVARELGLAPKTIQNRLTEVRHMLGAPNTVVLAVQWALRDRSNA